MPMFSSEQPWSDLRPKRWHHAHYESSAQPSPLRPPEVTLARYEIQVETKQFILLLKENARGRILRIIEETPKGYASVIVPAPGLRDFQRMLQAMVSADAEIAPKSQKAE